MASYKGTEIKPGTDAEVSKQVATIDGLGTATLAPQAPFDLVQPEPSTGAAGMLGEFESRAKSYQDGLQADAESAKQNEADSFGSYMTGLLSTEGEVAKTDRYYAAEADPLKKEVTTLSNKLAAEQHALRRRLERLDENKEGYFGTGLEQAKQKIENESLRVQADIAVVLAAKQGMYKDAKDIADRAVAKELEVQKNRIEALKANFERNSSLFTEKEKRAFEAKQSAMERDYDFEYSKRLKDYEQKIEQEDPLYKLQQRKLEAEVKKLENPDPTGLSPEALDRINKLPVASRTDLVNSTDTIDQLTRMKQLVADNDFVTLSNPTTEAGRTFQRLATDVADKLARERTGAVVGKDETASFKRIMGVSFLNRALAPADEINSALDDMLAKHNNVRTLIDPTGEITAYLGRNSTEEGYLDTVDAALGGNDPLAAWLNSLPQQ